MIVIVALMPDDGSMNMNCVFCDDEPVIVVPACTIVPVKFWPMPWLPARLDWLGDPMSGTTLTVPLRIVTSASVENAPFAAIGNCVVTSSNVRFVIVIVASG